MQIGFELENKDYEACGVHNFSTCTTFLDIAERTSIKNKSSISSYTTTGASAVYYDVSTIVGSYTCWARLCRCESLTFIWTTNKCVDISKVNNAERPEIIPCWTHKMKLWNVTQRLYRDALCREGREMKSHLTLHIFFDSLLQCCVVVKDWKVQALEGIFTNTERSHAYLGAARKYPNSVIDKWMETREPFDFK